MHSGSRLKALTKIQPAHPLLKIASLMWQSQVSQIWFLVLSYMWANSTGSRTNSRTSQKQPSEIRRVPGQLCGRLLLLPLSLETFARKGEFKGI